MTKLDELKGLLEDEKFKEDVVKFYEKGNGLAGVRIRKAMQFVKEKAQEIRFEISGIKSQKGDPAPTDPEQPAA